MSDIESLKERNARVEADKAWETSKTRRALIALGTYIIAALYLSFLGVSGAALHAAIPAGAYILSTFSLPFLKALWVKKIYRNNG